MYTTLHFERGTIGLYLPCTHQKQQHHEVRQQINLKQTIWQRRNARGGRQIIVNWWITSKKAEISSQYCRIKRA